MKWKENKIREVKGRGSKGVELKEKRRKEGNEGKKKKGK